MIAACEHPRVPTLANRGKAVAWCVEDDCDWRSDLVTTEAEAEVLAAEHRALHITAQAALW